MSNAPALARASVYPPGGRLLAGLLVFISRASLPILLLLIVLGIPALTPPLLVRLVIALALLPGVLAVLIRLGFLFAFENVDGKIVLRRGRRRRELECAAVERIEPWRVPLPGPGLSVQFGKLRLRLQTDRPHELLRVFGEEGPWMKSAGRHTVVVYAQARQTAGRARWYHLAGKFGLFPLLPTLIFFRLHQYILFGGLFGQYQLYGLRPYLSTFAFYWIMSLVYLAMYAGLWRILAEGVSLLAAKVAPRQALSARRQAERAVQIFYYGGACVLIALRFLA